MVDKHVCTSESIQSMHAVHQIIASNNGILPVMYVLPSQAWGFVFLPQLPTKQSGFARALRALRGCCSWC